jgi:hypothetical protein
MIYNNFDDHDTNTHNDCESPEVFTAVAMKNVAFWDVLRCSSCATDVSEENVTSNYMAKRIRERGAELQLTSTMKPLAGIVFVP